MNDCLNADIRDRLPDLLHEQLDAASRAMVVAHVAECVDCRDELELLRSVQKTLNAGTPRVDIAYIVNALPKAPARRPHIQSARRRWSDWRIAAGVTVLIAGGSSLVVLKRAPSAIDSRPPIVDTARTLPALPIATTGEVPAPATRAPAPSAATTLAANDASDSAGDEGPDSRFGGLNDAQMQTLLSEIDHLKAVPVTEPEPVTIRVDLKPNGPEGAR